MMATCLSQELGAWCGVHALHQVLRSIGYVSSAQLYVGQQRVTAPAEEDAAEDLEQPVVKFIEAGMSLEEAEKLLVERCDTGEMGHWNHTPLSYLQANLEELGSANLTLADVKNEPSALCRSIREATDASLRLLLQGSPALSDVLNGTPRWCVWMCDIRCHRLSKLRARVVTNISYGNACC